MHKDNAYVGSMYTRTYVPHAYVTEFVKKGFVHASTFLLERCVTRIASVQSIALKFGSRSFLSLHLYVYMAEHLGPTACLQCLFKAAK